MFISFLFERPFHFVREIMKLLAVFLKLSSIVYCGESTILLSFTTRRATIYSGRHKRTITLKTIFCKCLPEKFAYRQKKTISYGFTSITDILYNIISKLCQATIRCFLGFFPVKLEIIT